MTDSQQCINTHPVKFRCLVEESQCGGLWSTVPFPEGRREEPHLAPDHAVPQARPARLQPQDGDYQRVQEEREATLDQINSTNCNRLYLSVRSSVLNVLIHYSSVYNTNLLVTIKHFNSDFHYANISYEVSFYSVTNAVMSKDKSVDLAILDFRQCFDSMSVEITTNDLYDISVDSDHLNLINESDSVSNIAVKTPLGLTKRVDLQKIVKQGEVTSSLKCTVTVDSISQNHVANLEDHLYRYKEIVPVPPLGMVDDQINVSKCGLDSVLSVAHLNAQANLKKLQFGASKCHKMHISKCDTACPH